LLYNSLITKLSTPPYKHLKEHTTLLAYLLPCPAAHVPITVHEVEELLDIWHNLQLMVQ